MSRVSESDCSAELDDLDLMTGIVRREQAYLEHLYDRYGSMVFAVCLRVLRDHMDAEEALIDTFWQLWDRADRYDETRGSVPGYLLMLARSRSLDRLRARSSANSVAKIEDVLGHGGGPADNGPGMHEPFDDALLVEQRARLAKALELLSEPQREAIELAFFEGLTHTQIAEALGEPLGTIKTRIRQGLIRLRDVMRTSSSEDEGGDPS